MKRIFTLFTLVLLSLSLFAAEKKPQTLLTIASVERSDIRVVIDGRRFEPNTNYMRIRDMRPGYHTVKVYRERNVGFYTIFGKKYELVFSNSMMIKPQSSITIAIDRFGRAR